MAKAFASYSHHMTHRLSVVESIFDDIIHSTSVCIKFQMLLKRSCAAKIEFYWIKMNLDLNFMSEYKGNHRMLLLFFMWFVTN